MSARGKRRGHDPNEVTGKATPPADHAAQRAAMLRQGAAASAGLAQRARRMEDNPFRFPVFPKAATPPSGTMAQDAALKMAYDDASGAWASGGYADTVQFPGYNYLSELAQQQEYRVLSETIADDATRKWVDFDVTGDDAEADRRLTQDPKGEAERRADPDERRKRVKQAGKGDKVKALKDDQDRLGLRETFYALSRDDGLFGRSHLYMNFGEDLGSRVTELSTLIGDGRDDVSHAKVGRGAFKSVKVVEPNWSYPMGYNAVNPLMDNWYRPSTWYVMGTPIDGSRFLTLVSRPVPDILKPAYGFGGISLSQLAHKYIRIWLQTKQATADLIRNFSVMVLMTDLSTLLSPTEGAGGLIARADLFNAVRDNQGLMVLNKDSEDFKNVSASLSGLSELQSQAQEHMASVSRIPLVKLTGISPSGLNACLTGETLILTDRGQVPIRDVTLLDKVMTRRGFAKLTFSGATKYATELIEIRTKDATLRCTPNHPIWIPSTNAFVAAENVRVGHRLLLIGGKNVAQNTRPPSLGVEDGGGKIQQGITRRLIREQNDLFSFTEQCGRSIADLFPTAITFTIVTAIKKTIKSAILKLCGVLITQHSMVSTLVLAPTAVRLSRNEFCAPTAARNFQSKNFRANGNFVATNASLRTEELKNRLKQNPNRFAFAEFAKTLFSRSEKTQSSVLVNALRQAKTVLDICARIIFRTPKSGEIISIKRLQATELVYDLTVERGCLPEFFANGILVHNSSEGEIRVYYDSIAAYQNRSLRPLLVKVSNFQQLSLFGEVDPEITLRFEPLWELTDAELGDKQKADAERHQLYVDMGVVSSADVRRIITDDPELPYTNLDPDDVPDLLEEEEQGGLEPVGGRPDPQAQELADNSSNKKNDQS